MAKESGLNLLNYKTKESADMVVKHPETGEETDAVITVAGKDSKIWRQIEAERAQKAIDKMSKGKKYKFDAADLDNRKQLVQVILDWKNLAPDFPYSKENAEILASDNGLAWLFEQIEEFMNDRSNFF